MVMAEFQPADGGALAIHICATFPLIADGYGVRYEVELRLSLFALPGS
jgi:hypothetical protein